MASTIFPSSIDWDEGIDLPMFGQEYMYAFYHALASDSAFTVLFAGDSTFAESKGTAAAVDGQFKKAMNQYGYRNGTYYNSAVSGYTASNWVQNVLSSDISKNPTLYIIRYGLNNESGSTDEERANSFYTVMSGALSTIRASLPVSSCSIILMMPNSSNDETNHRGYSMHKALDPKVRALAREYGCGFIDTFRNWYDSGVYAANMYDDPYGDGRHVHPTSEQNINITSSLINFVLPSTLRRSSYIGRLATSSEVASGGTAYIPLPAGTTWTSLQPLHAWLLVAGAGLFGEAVDLELIDGVNNRLQVRNNGGAAGYIYVDYTVVPTV